MKKIEAYVRPHKWNDVLVALERTPGFSGVSATDVRGISAGLEAARATTADDALDTLRYTRVDLVCDDNDVDAMVKALEKAAHTGLQGDGRVFVLNVESACMIRDVET